MSLCEKPRKHAMNRAANNHSDDTRLKLHADAESNNEIQNAKVVAPRERLLSWIALLKTSIEPECDDDGNPNQDNERHEEIGAGEIPEACESHDHLTRHKISHRSWERDRLEMIAF